MQMEYDTCRFFLGFCALSFTFRNKTKFHRPFIVSHCQANQSELLEKKNIGVRYNATFSIH